VDFSFEPDEFYAVTQIDIAFVTATFCKARASELDGSTASKSR
jgi:hypothetical protein